MKRRRPGPPREDPPPRGEDDELARVFGDVEPLASKGRVPARDGAPPRVEPVAAAAPAPATSLAVTIGDEHIEGKVADLDPRVLRPLRRGEPAAEAVLDLHGLHRDAAEREVARFLASSADLGRRVVRIVPGRGLHSESGPILRRELARWLGASPCVLAFVPAPTHAGGTGAVHVLLRARRGSI